MIVLNIDTFTIEELKEVRDRLCKKLRSTGPYDAAHKTLSNTLAEVITLLTMKGDTDPWYLEDRPTSTI